MSTIRKVVGVKESISRTKAEQLAVDLGWSSDRALTSEQKAAHQLRIHLVEEGEGGNWKPLFDARAQGKIDQREVRLIEHDVRLGPLAGRVNHFNISHQDLLCHEEKPPPRSRIVRARL